MIVDASTAKPSTEPTNQAYIKIKSKNDEVKAVNLYQNANENPKIQTSKHQNIKPSKHQNNKQIKNEKWGKAVPWINCFATINMSGRVSATPNSDGNRKYECKVYKKLILAIAYTRHRCI